MTDKLTAEKARREQARPQAQAGARPEASSGPPEELPPAPWQRTPTRAARRRRDPITQEMIVKTALSILDAEGLDGLSMRRIADELDTGAASLYWHVGSKDGLLDLLFDHVIGEQQVPSPDPERWQEQLKEVARAQRATILRHRDIVAVSLGRIPMGPHALRYSEKVLAILRAGGVPDWLAVAGQQLLIAVVNGFTLDETSTEPGPGGQAAEGEHRGGARRGGEHGDDGGTVPQVSQDDASRYIASLPPGQFPNLTALAGHFSSVDPDERFELLLDIFVDGLAQRAAAR
jgi:AcrR family transcriptional regulator